MVKLQDESTTMDLQVDEPIFDRSTIPSNLGTPTTDSTTVEEILVTTVSEKDEDPTLPVVTMTSDDDDEESSIVSNSFIYDDRLKTSSISLSSNRRGRQRRTFGSTDQGASTDNKNSFQQTSTIQSVVQDIMHFTAASFQDGNSSNNSDTDEENEDEPERFDEHPSDDPTSMSNHKNDNNNCDDDDNKQTSPDDEEPSDSTTVSLPHELYTQHFNEYKIVEKDAVYENNGKDVVDQDNVDEAVHGDEAIKGEIVDKDLVGEDAINEELVGEEVVDDDVSSEEVADKRVVNQVSEESCGGEAKDDSVVKKAVMIESINEDYTKNADAIHSKHSQQLNVIGENSETDHAATCSRNDQCEPCHGKLSNTSQAEETFNVNQAIEQSEAVTSKIDYFIYTTQAAGATTGNTQLSNVTTLPDEAKDASKPTTTNDDVELDVEAVLYSTEYLFSQVTDKLSVTVKDIIQSLCAEYNVTKLKKPLKNAVRQKLIELIEEEQNAVEEDEDNNDTDQDEVDGNDIIQEEANGEDDEYDNDGDISETSIDGDKDDDFDPDEERKKKQNKKAARKRLLKKGSRKLNTDEGSGDEEPISRSRKPRKVNKKSKKSALRIHHEQLRKRRLEELRVRNEELQAMASKLDQERAELIAAKFDTNAVEMREERLEKRLDLLQKLDQKRIQCVTIQPPVPLISPVEEDAEQDNSSDEDNEDEHDAPTKDEEADFSSAEEDSLDEMELEIIGADGKEMMLPTLLTREQVKVSINPALAMLDLADQAKLKPTQRAVNRFSPSRSLNARAQLRQKLLSKQRQMGNEWLARELGYKSQEDHLRDCQLAEQKKLEMIRKREEARVKENERRLLRERMLKLEQQQYEIVTDGQNQDNIQANDDEEDDEDYKPDEEGSKADLNEDELVGGENNDDDDEDEEEIELAKIIESENRRNTIDEDSPTSVEDKNVINVDRTSGLTEVASEENENLIPANEGLSENVSSAFSGDESIATANVHKAQPQTVDSMPSVDNSSTVQETACEVEDSIGISQDDTENLSQDPSRLETQMPVGNNVHSDVSEPSIDTRNGAEDDLTITETSGLEDDENDNANEGEQDTGITEDSADKASKPSGPRNSAWRALLEKEAEQLKKKKKNGLIEEEADEEEEEQVAGLEDFGFTVAKKKNDDDEDEGDADLVDEDDLKHVVDDVSDDEGDEEAGEVARKLMEQKEEKERHKEMLRRMRDGYDGRRGGIAAGTGARGIHRFDQLVAADNKEDAKRLGLLNDDELDSEDEGGEKAEGDEDDEEDEAALIDKMLKDRFLHRNSDDIEAENFSDDDEDEDNTEGGTDNPEDEEEREQERLAKRFAKRARMQRLLETYEHDEEFSQLKLIDEDTTFKQELQMMKNGLSRKRSQSSQLGNSNSIIGASSSELDGGHSKKQKNDINKTLCFSIFNRGGSLASALQTNRSKQRTSFVRTGSTGTNNSSSQETTSSYLKSIAFSHVVFRSVSGTTNTNNSKQSNMSYSNSSNHGRSMPSSKTSSSHRPSKSSGTTSLFSQSIVSNGFHKRKR